MTTKKKVKSNAFRGRVLSAALSLGLLAAAGMVGMYTVGKTEQRKEEEELAKKQEESLRIAALEEKQKEIQIEETKEQETTEEEVRSTVVSSGGAVASFDRDVQFGPELESDFVVVEKSSTDLVKEGLEESFMEEFPIEAALEYSFSPGSEPLLWPIAGNIIMDYSMD